MITETIHIGRYSVVVCSLFLQSALLLGLGACTNPNHSSISYSEQGRAEAAWLKGAKRPPEPRTLYALAKILVAQGRDDQAQFVLARLMHEHPKFIMAYIEQAEIHMRHDRNNAAETILSEGLAVLPKDPVLLNNLGMCYMFRRDYQRALAQFRTATAAAPDNARYRVNLALALGLLGRYEESLAVYKQALSADEAHFNLAVICEARNDHDRAVSEFRISRWLRESSAKKQKPKPSTRPAKQQPPAAQKK